jgi:hypothetical protein
MYQSLAPIVSSSVYDAAPNSSYKIWTEMDQRLAPKVSMIANVTKFIHDTVQ